MPTNKNEGLDETFPDKLNPISGHKGQVDSHPTSLIIQMDRRNYLVTGKVLLLHFII